MWESWSSTLLSELLHGYVNEQWVACHIAEERAAASVIPTPEDETEASCATAQLASNDVTEAETNLSYGHLQARRV